MAIDAIVGALTSLADFAAPAAAAADIGAGAAAADIGGAIALPEIAVTAAAPEVAAGIGTEAALGGADLLGAGALGATELAGGAGAGAAELGFGGAAADLTGGAVAGAAPIATEGVSAVAPAAALGASAAGGVPSDVLAGTTGPLSALDTGTGPSTFDQLWQGEVSQLPAGGSVDLSAPGGAVDTAQSFAATTEPNFTPANPLGADAFANAPGATPGALSGTSATTMEALAAGVDPTLNTLPAGVPEALAGEPVAAPAAAPVIPTSLASSTIAPGGVAAGGASDVSAIAGSTSPLPAGTSLTGAGAGVSPGVSSLLSGSTLRNAALLAPIAGLGLTLARGQPSLPPAEQQALNNLGPAQNFANQQLTGAANNQITPAQAQEITTWEQQQINQTYQLYASMGRNPNQDTDYLQAIANIHSQALAMKQNFIDSMVKNGLAAQGAVDSTLQSAAALQVQSDEAFQSALTSSLSSFGLVAAISSVGNKTA